MDIFAPENVGNHVMCLIEKDGVQVKYWVKWTHAIVGLMIDRKSMSIKILDPSKTANVYAKDVSSGWKILEVGI